VRVFQKRTGTYGNVRDRTRTYEIVRVRTRSYKNVQERTRTYGNVQNIFDVRCCFRSTWRFRGPFAREFRRWFCDLGNLGALRRSAECRNSKLEIRRKSQAQSPKPVAHKSRITDRVSALSPTRLQLSKSYQQSAVGCQLLPNSQRPAALNAAPYAGSRAASPARTAHSAVPPYLPAMYLVFARKTVTWRVSRIAKP
jgi:hypothetical protein